jgi:hypothetical protein
MRFNPCCVALENHAIRGSWGCQLFRAPKSVNRFSRPSDELRPLDDVRSNRRRTSPSATSMPNLPYWNVLSTGWTTFDNAHASERIRPVEPIRLPAHWIRMLESGAGRLLSRGHAVDAEKLTEARSGAPRTLLHPRKAESEHVILLGRYLRTSRCRSGQVHAAGSTVT